MGGLSAHWGEGEVGEAVGGGGLGALVAHSSGEAYLFGGGGGGAGRGVGVGAGEAI